MTCISSLVSLLLTVIIPLRLTHRAVKNNDSTKVWAIYWAFYSLFNGIFWLLPFLSGYNNSYTRAPFNFIFVLFLVWLYHDSFKVR